VWAREGEGEGVWAEEGSEAEECSAVMKGVEVLDWERDLTEPERDLDLTFGVLAEPFVRDFLGPSGVPLDALSLPLDTLVLMGVFACAGLDWLERLACFGVA